MAPDMLDQGPVALPDDCHCTLPVKPVTLRLIFLPVQIVPGETAAVPATGGLVPILTAIVFDAVQHPSWPPVATQVNTVEAVSVPVGLATVALLNPVEGDQEYVI